MPDSALLTTTIEEVLARQPGNACALEDERGCRLSFGELEWRNARTRRLLAELGIGREDVVALVLRNGIETAALFLGLVSQCRVAPINPGYTASEIEFALRDLKASALITTGGCQEALDAALLCRVGVILIQPSQSAAYELTTDMPRRAAAYRAQDANPDGIALLLHTSGTTARPKLAGLTNRQLWLSARGVANVLEFSQEDCGLSFMPYFHIHGLVAGLLAPVLAGGRICCIRGFQATSFFSTLASTRATWYTAVPAMHQAILARAVRNPEALASHRLRFIRSSSSPLHGPVWSQLESAFEVQVINAYGMTEAAHQIASVRLHAAGQAAGSRGTVGLSSGPEIAVMSQDGVLLPPGERGEVVLRGPQILGAYLSPPNANEIAFSDGWFRTGDEGYLNEAGELALTGRLKEMINVGGEKIAPAEIDEALMHHPAVRQALAFGVACPKRGERVYAAVVLESETGERDLKAFLIDRLARFKVPERILILDEIPKGPTGKMQRMAMASTLGLTQPPPLKHGPKDWSSSSVLQRPNKASARGDPL